MKIFTAALILPFSEAAFFSGPANFFTHPTKTQSDSTGKSIKSFEILPDDIFNTQIIVFLDSDALIRLGMLNKSLQRLSNKIRDVETLKMIKEYGIEEKYDFGKHLDDEEIMRELRRVAFCFIEISKNLDDYLNREDFLFSIQTAHMLGYNLYVPKLALAIFKASYKFYFFNRFFQNVLQAPEKYNEVFKYLAKEHYKCRRSFLVWHIRKDFDAAHDFDFKALEKYNNASKYNVIKVGGLVITIHLLNAISGLIYFSMKYANMEYANLTAFLLALVSALITRYLNKRFEEFS